MATIPTSSGIYQILCTSNNKIYIGSGKNLQSRWHNHLSELNRGCHHNVMLQRAWNKYGADAFVFSVLEFVEAKDLVAREQHWIDTTNCCDRSIGFNILPKARSALGLKLSQRAIEKIRTRLSKTWEGFIDPDGIPLPPITNLRAFCIMHGLYSSAMQSLAHGNPQFQSHKGWTHRNSPPRKEKAPPPQNDNTIIWEGFIDPDGNLVGPIAHLEKFCKERGLDPTNMRSVAYGRRQSHRGWTHVNAAPYKTKPHKGRY